MPYIARTCRPAVLLLAVVVATNPAWAHGQTAIKETRPLAATGRLLVDNMAGAITIKGWDSNEVAIGGWLGEDVEKLEISGDARSLNVIVHYPSRIHGHIDESQLELWVPARAQLQIDAVSADIVVDNSSGRIAAKTVSGNLYLSVGSGEIEASTVSGDLLIKAPAFHTVLNSVSGDLRVDGLRGVLKAETVSGSWRSAAAASASCPCRACRAILICGCRSMPMRSSVPRPCPAISPCSCRNRRTRS